MTDFELSIVLTSDQEMRELNRAWRGLNRTTDVLSFSQTENSGARAAAGASGLTGGRSRRGLLMLGDVVISTETAARQAKAAGHSLEREIHHLLIHGILHLLGHDHIRGGRQARNMRMLERKVAIALQAHDRPRLHRGHRGDRK